VTEIERPFEPPRPDDRELSSRYVNICRAFLINGWGWSESEFSQFVRDRTFALQRWPEWFNQNDPAGHLAGAVIPAPLRERNSTERFRSALLALVDDIRHIIEAATVYYTRIDVDWTAVACEVQSAIQEFEGRCKPRLRRTQRFRNPKSRGGIAG
jgi:hypothetical protein